MNAQAESMTPRRGKYLPRLIARENTFFTKDVAVLREFFFRDSWQHFVDDQIYVGLATRLVFGRNIVRAQESRHVTQRSFIVQLIDRAENLQLVFKRQAISGL